MIIAVDGPSGSGKSSTARGVATRLGLQYLDTGAMYRAVTWSALEHGIDLDDTEAVAARARDLDLSISTDPGRGRFVADGTDVTESIRDPRISAVVSKIATNLDVRAELRRRQRAIIDAAQPTGGIVVEGRDIATVVATDAELKVLLTADTDARMSRRKAELAEGAVTAEQLRDQIVRRDADDSTVSQFQVASDGAVEIDSTHLSLDEVIDVVCRLAKEADAVARDISLTPGAQDFRPSFFTLAFWPFEISRYLPVGEYGSIQLRIVLLKSPLQRLHLHDEIVGLLFRIERHRQDLINTSSLRRANQLLERGGCRGSSGIRRGQREAGSAGDRFDLVNRTSGVGIEREPLTSRCSRVESRAGPGDILRAHCQRYRTGQRCRFLQLMDAHAFHSHRRSVAADAMAKCLDVRQLGFALKLIQHLLDLALHRRLFRHKETENLPDNREERADNCALRTRGRKDGRKHGDDACADVHDRCSA